MSLAWSFYISTVLVYLGVDVMACWGLNLQYGYTGILNFSFIIYQAAGAYTAAVLTLGPQHRRQFPAIHRRREPAVPAPDYRRRDRGRPAVGGRRRDRAAPAAKPTTRRWSSWSSP